MNSSTSQTATSISPWQVFLIFLRLGLTSFGGPIAHLGYFRDEFIARRRWMTDRSYADLVALCHFLPGPASSQVGLAIGFSQARYSGALAAWAGFTLPSAILMMICAISLNTWGNILPDEVIHGLKIVTVAVVAQAVWGMAGNICTDRVRLSLMVLLASLIMLMPTALTQIGIIVAAGIIGAIALDPNQSANPEPLPMSISRKVGLFWLISFLILLFGLPVLAHLFPNQLVSLVDIFYRAGSLVFGGGHVVLPLLQAEIVPANMMTNDTFLAGYGLAQAVPGPLFTFSAFLGASVQTSHYEPALLGMLALLAIFAPSFLLVIGILPFWEKLRSNLKMQSVMAGVNVAVAGLLLSALYNPVWTSAIKSSQDFSLALLAFIALISWKLPPWFVVIATVTLNYGVSLLI